METVTSAALFLMALVFMCSLVVIAMAVTTFVDSFYETMKKLRDEL